MTDPLEGFSPPIRAWFREEFGIPTAPQSSGWPPIQRGDHTLILAPTGSGKTLAAFLWAIDRLYHTLSDPQAAARGGVRVLYVSPLKALNYDIERNLRIPLEGIRATARQIGYRLPSLRVAVRTGDTPGHYRSQMLKQPPHILITTPESLYLMLTSPRARMILQTVGTVIVDEIHTLCGNKRGVHLSVSLERLAHLAAHPIQRIGLSATIRPLDEVARFLGGLEPRSSGDGGSASGVQDVPVLQLRPVTIVDAGYRKPLSLKVITAVEDLRELPGSSIWPSLIPRVLDDIREHRTTLVFCNNRRLAERTADRLNAQLAAEQSEDVAPGSTEALSPGGVVRDAGMFAIGADGPIRAHHGSMSKEARHAMEEDLKTGRLPALVGTSSLELGIDIGAIDLVVQLQSPKSVAQALQRVGRSGHFVGQTSVGHIYPTYYEDLLEASAVARGMLEGAVEPTYTPQNALDVLAQQIVAMVAVEQWRVDDMFRLVRQSYAYHGLAPTSFHLVLEMLAGKFHLEDSGEPRSPSLLRARIGWDQVNGLLNALPGSRLLAVANAGTIPDRGTYGLYLGDGRMRLGDLDEEFVFETRVGDAILFGSSVWRVLDITNDRVIVDNAAGATPRMPFWRGDYPWRTYELGLSVGRLRGEIAERIRAGTAGEHLLHWLTSTCALDANSAGNLVAYVARQLEANRVPSSDTTVVVESFPDALGDRHLIVHAPYGGRVNGAWALALAGALRERAGVEVETEVDDDGILLHFAHSGGEGAIEIVRQLTPREACDRILRSLPDSPVFGAQFRMNAARALLLPRSLGRKRTPFWLQRLRARDLLLAVRKFDDFPIVAETYRDCLSDVLDLPHLEEVLTRIQSGAIRIMYIESAIPSPVASGLLSKFVDRYMYEWDAPKADSQLQVLSLRAQVLTDLMAKVDLSGLFEPQAISEVSGRSQHLVPGYQARSAEELALLLLDLGDLTEEEVAARSAGSGLAWLQRLAEQGRVVRLAVPTKAGQSVRWVPRELVDEYRSAFDSTGETSAERILRRFLRNSGPISREAILERYRFVETWLAATLDRLVESGAIVRGRFSPSAVADEFCDRQLVDRMHRRTVAILREKVQPVPLSAYQQFMMRWQHLHPESRTSAMEGLRIVLAQQFGIALPWDVWEQDVLPERVGGYVPGHIDALCREAEVVWVVSGQDARRPRVRFFRRGEGALFLEAPRAEDLSAAAQRVYRFLKDEGASFMSDLQAGIAERDAAIADALTELVLAGLVTNDDLHALRMMIEGRDAVRPGSKDDGPSERPFLSQLAGVRPHGRVSRERYRGARLRAGRRLWANTKASGWPGRWSLVHRSAILGPDLAGDERGEWLAMSLLRRYGVLARECLHTEAERAWWSLVYPHLARMEMRGEARRGYFVGGLSGTQFALPEAVEQLRAAHAGGDNALVVMNALDPANVLAAGDETVSTTDVRPGFSRRPSTHLVFQRGTPVLIAEEHGRRITVREGTSLEVTLRALRAYFERPGAARHQVVEQWNAAPVLESDGAQSLQTLGFSRTPAGLERWLYQ